MKRGEIYYADLRPAYGNEQGGVRPVLILQNDVGNYFSSITIVANITKKSHHKVSLPTHVDLSAREGLYCDSIIMTEQLRTIDENRLMTLVHFRQEKAIITNQY